MHATFELHYRSRSFRISTEKQRMVALAVDLIVFKPTSMLSTTGRVALSQKPSSKSMFICAQKIGTHAAFGGSDNSG